MFWQAATEIWRCYYWKKSCSAIFKKIWFSLKNGCCLFSSLVKYIPSHSPNRTCYWTKLNSHLLMYICGNSSFDWHFGYWLQYQFSFFAFFFSFNASVNSWGHRNMPVMTAMFFGDIAKLVCVLGQYLLIQLDFYPTCGVRKTIVVVSIVSPPRRQNAMVENTHCSVLYPLSSQINQLVQSISLYLSISKDQLKFNRNIKNRKMSRYKLSGLSGAFIMQPPTCIMFPFTFQQLQ